MGTNRVSGTADDVNLGEVHRSWTKVQGHRKKTVTKVIGATSKLVFKYAMRPLRCLTLRMQSF